MCQTGAHMAPLLSLYRWCNCTVLWLQGFTRRLSFRKRILTKAMIRRAGGMAGWQIQRPASSTFEIVICFQRRRRRRVKQHISAAELCVTHLAYKHACVRMNFIFFLQFVIVVAFPLLLALFSSTHSAPCAFPFALRALFQGRSTVRRRRWKRATQAWSSARSPCLCGWPLVSWLAMRDRTVFAIRSPLKVFQSMKWRRERERERRKEVNALKIRIVMSKKP